MPGCVYRRTRFSRSSHEEVICESVRVEPEIPCQTQKDRNARNRAAEQAQERGHRKDAKCPNVRHGVAGLKCSVWAFGLALVRPLHIPVLF